MDQHRPFNDELCVHLFKEDRSDADDDSSSVYEEHPNASICSDRQRFINAYLKLENQLSRSSQHHRPSLPLSFINPSCLTLNETCLSQNLQHTLLVPNSLSSQPAYGHLQQMYHHFKSGAAPPLRLLSTSDLTRPTISPVQLHNQMVGSQLIFNSITDPLVPGNVYESSRNSDNDAMRSKCKEQPELSKGRDERRRATHNEVERRRRDKINTWIMKLAKLVPQCSGDHSKYGQSKGGILAKAYDYIGEMNEAKTNFKEIARQNKLLTDELLQMRHQNNQLLNEIAQLKNVKLKEHHQCNCGARQ